MQQLETMHAKRVKRYLYFKPSSHVHIHFGTLLYYEENYVSNVERLTNQYTRAKMLNTPKLGIGFNYWQSTQHLVRC